MPAVRFPLGDIAALDRRENHEGDRNANENRLYERQDQFDIL